MEKENTNYIKVEDLKEGYLYRIEARNGSYGIWRPKKGDFLLYRVKFSNHYTFGEIHWDLSEDFGTAKPLQELEPCPFSEEDLESRLVSWEKAGLKQTEWAKKAGVKEVWCKPKEKEILAWLADRQEYWDNHYKEENCG